MISLPQVPQVAPPTVVPLTDPDSLVAGLGRDVGKLVAGALVTHGLVAQSDMQLAIGVIVGVLSLAWSVWQKYQTTHWVAAASALPADASRAQIAAVASKPVEEVPAVLTAVAAMPAADKKKLAELLAPYTVAPPK